MHSIIDQLALYDDFKCEFFFQNTLTPNCPLCLRQSVFVRFLKQKSYIFSAVATVASREITARRTAVFTTPDTPSLGPLPRREPKRFLSRLNPKSSSEKLMSQDGTFDLYWTPHPSLNSINLVMVRCLFDMLTKCCTACPSCLRSLLIMVIASATMWSPSWSGQR